MKKLLALLLVLIIASFACVSCWNDNTDDTPGGGNNNGDGTGDILDNEEPDDGEPDNIDSDGWTKVDK